VAPIITGIIIIIIIPMCNIFKIIYLQECF
jgi:hypothetical protein